MIVISSFSISLLAQEHATSKNDKGKINLNKDTLSNKIHSDSLLQKKKKVDSAVHRLGSKVNSVTDFQFSSLPKRLYRDDTTIMQADTTNRQSQIKNSKTDLLPRKKRYYDSLSYKRKKADTVIQRISSRLDSLSNFKLSSLLRKRQHVEDSTKTISDTTRERETHKPIKTDSLKKQYTKSLKSLNSAPDTVQQKVDAGLKTAQKKIDSKTGFLDSLQMNVQNPLTGKASNYSMDGLQTSLPSKDIALKDVSTSGLTLPSATSPDLKLDKDLKIPDVNPMDKASDEIKDLKQRPQKQLENNNLLKEAGEIKDKTKQVSEVTKKAEVYQEDIKNVKEGGLEKAKALPEEAEKAAANLSGVKELQTETQKFETTKNVLDQYQDAVRELNEKKLLEQGKELGQKQLTDHFAGNEDKLKAGAAQLDKLKKKYGNIPDSRYLPKRALNPLNGKPLIERLVPGINLQVFEQRNLVNIDASPFIAYKISPRWRVGMGTTYRFQFNKKVQLIEENPAYGYRAFTNILIWGGIHFHLEGEWMRLVTYDFYKQTFNTEDGKKWIHGLHAGILKHYKVSKKVNGNFQVLYNFLYERNGLYPNKVNMRFGFEFPLKKKKRISIEK